MRLNLQKFGGKQPWEMTREEYRVYLLPLYEEKYSELQQRRPSLEDSGYDAWQSETKVVSKVLEDLRDPSTAEDMSMDEFAGRGGINNPLLMHVRRVEEAVYSNKPVPEKVLDEYPDLRHSSVNAGKQPWQMTKAELEEFEVPSMGDSSVDPDSIAEMREEGGTLLDYAGDDWMIRDWLGAHSNEPGWDVSYLAEQVKQNEPITVYRTTDVEDTIFPGAYVTPSKRYAIDHGERSISGEHLMEPASYKLLSLSVRPDELVAVNPLEFYYAPESIFVWHETQIRDALERGEDVPHEVLADYHHLTEGSARLNLRKWAFNNVWDLMDDDLIQWWVQWLAREEGFRKEGLTEEDMRAMIRRYYDHINMPEEGLDRAIQMIIDQYIDQYGKYVPEVDLDML